MTEVRDPMASILEFNARFAEVRSACHNSDGRLPRGWFDDQRLRGYVAEQPYGLKRVTPSTAGYVEGEPVDVRRMYKMLVSDVRFTIGHAALRHEAAYTPQARALTVIRFAEDLVTRCESVLDEDVQVRLRTALLQRREEANDKNYMHLFRRQADREHSACALLAETYWGDRRAFIRLTKSNGAGAIGRTFHHHGMGGGRIGTYVEPSVVLTTEALARRAQELIYGTILYAVHTLHPRPAANSQWCFNLIRALSCIDVLDGEVTGSKMRGTLACELFRDSLRGFNTQAHNEAWARGLT